MNRNTIGVYKMESAEQFEQLKDTIEVIMNRMASEKDFKIFEWELMNNQLSPKIISKEVKAFFDLLMWGEKSELKFKTFPKFQWSFCDEKMIVKTTSILDTNRFIDLLSSIDDDKLQIEKLINFQWNDDLSEITIEIAKEDVTGLFEAIFEINKPKRNTKRKIKINNQFSYSELEISFYSDVIMSVLNNSISNIIAYFNKKNMGKYSKVYNEIFFSDHHTFKSAVKEYLLKFEIEDSESIIDAINYFGFEINSKVPKILFPFYVYSLNKNYAHLSSSVKKKLEIVIEKRLSLEETESDYPIQVETYRNAQIDFKRFINSLMCINEYYDEAKCNISLNLFLFNRYTNLYDLFESLELFKGSYFYKSIEITGEMWKVYRAKQNKKKYKIPNIVNNKYAKHKHKSNMFKDIGKFSKIDSLSVKSLLMSNLTDDEIPEIDNLLEIMNFLLNNCKQELLNYVAQEFDFSDQNIPEKISLDYSIYKLFSNDEPYEGLIKNANEKLKIYEPNKANLNETHLFEAYAYSYDSFQKSRG